jgi:hypothetical protein
MLSHAPWACDVCRLEHRAPQPGPQSEFLACNADIALTGGAVGGGKSWILLFDALQAALQMPHWNGLIAREVATRMKIGGGLWDEARRVFAGSGVNGRDPEFRAGEYMDVTWPNGAKLSFKHVSKWNYEGYKGPGFDWIGFDEVNEVPFGAVMFLLTRLRSVRGGHPVMRWSCNPDPDHPVAELVEPYLLPDGEADRSQSGRIRWIARKRDRLVIADTREAVAKLAGVEPALAMSFTFIPSLLEDNPVLDLVDPEYRTRLAVGSEDPVRLAQLLRGNWKVRRSTGGPFERERWGLVSEPLAPIVLRVRAWDKAASRPDLTKKGSEDPDYTTGPEMLFDAAGRFYLAGLVACREDTGKRDQIIASTVERDGAGVTQVHKQGPSDTGKSDVRYTAPVLAAGGGDVRVLLERTAKEVRAVPMTRALALGMKDGRPRLPSEPLAPGELFERRGFILTGEVRDARGQLIDAGWMSLPYQDAGSHPATLGALVWSQFNAWPTGDHDDILDAMFDAFAVGTAEPGRQLSTERRAAQLTRGRR